MLTNSTLHRLGIVGESTRLSMAESVAPCTERSLAPCIRENSQRNGGGFGGLTRSHEPESKTSFQSSRAPSRDGVPLTRERGNPRTDRIPDHLREYRSRNVHRHFSCCANAVDRWRVGSRSWRGGPTAVDDRAGTLLARAKWPVFYWSSNPWRHRDARVRPDMERADVGMGSR